MSVQPILDRAQHKQGKNAENLSNRWRNFSGFKKKGLAAVAAVPVSVFL